MAWKTSHRRDRLPYNWKLIRAKVLERDQYHCAVPGCAVPATDVDHKLAMSDSHKLEDLQSLCRKHHSIKSSLEGANARWEKRRRLRRPPEQHPGLIAEPGTEPVLPWQVRLEN